MSNLVKHYDTIAISFNKFWVYSDEFVLNLVKDLEQSLCFQDGDTFVDIGCGTGIYATRLIARSESRFSTLCIDTSQRMLNQIPADESLVKIQMSASEFSKSGIKFNKGLLKEVMHHIENKEEVVCGLCKNLSNAGVILFLISPETVDYPLFDKALEVRQNTKSIELMIVELLQSQGLVVSIERKCYPVKLDKARFLNMIRGRYLSFLSKFSDKELEEGIKEMQQKLTTCSEVNFTENYIFIKGMKTNAI